MKNLEEFKRICAGPVWDGNLISKDGRDALVKAGYVARHNGWNLLTVDGVDVAVAFGLLSTSRYFFHEKADAVAQRLGFLPAAIPSQRELQDRGLFRLAEMCFGHMETARSLLHGLTLRMDVSANEAEAFEVGMPYSFGKMNAWVDSKGEVEPGKKRVIFVMRRPPLLQPPKLP